MKQKIKIMNAKPELSDEEIRSYMDFEGLLSKHKTFTSKGYPLLKWSITVLIVIGGICILSVTNPKLSVPVQQKTEAPPEVSEPQPPPIESVNIESHTEKKEELSQPVKIPARKRPAKGEVTLPKENVYVQAEPVDGYTKLYEYFNHHLVYPPEALQDSVQGVVTISFTINTVGKGEKIEVGQSLGEPFEREAKRLIENMPLWKPATLNGNAVSSKISLPLTFQIQKLKSNHE
jgi:protein TonB